ncbi:4-alpha-glucanotransferase [Clostridium sp. P21]|uniref:4-alpha-glucanotransferase n=1 Tax=Clostridium muellerianum TaxID=2716538 RepID=A0A7Y0EL07_9CLOT|nr:4-alpha-glucanotransferase [Clostridium muellerianum]NMM65346.1 4-alpha-glucanotransferase [Clostridium muellerianum]
MGIRGSGILMHITSLPGSYGIGTFGKVAYEFIDFLVKSGQRYWQILPLNPTGVGDSPYQPFSAFAGNPYFIDFDILAEQGLLEKNKYENMDFGSNNTKVDYEKIFNNKMPILRIAFKNCKEKHKEKHKEKIRSFRDKNRKWLEDYALYMAIKSKVDLNSWQHWEENIKFRKEDTLNYYKEVLKEEIDYWVFLQYVFFSQWAELKNYANNNGIKIIGDIPIYVAEDSADAWSNSEIFLFDEDKKPIVVSGCPPDSFSDTGQLWGNPIYDWSYLNKTNYKWWIERIKWNINLYDVIRIDHFRGFESFWQVPYGEQTAANGKWEKGPGMKLFNEVKKALGKINIIAEDLGYLTKEVIEFRIASGFPGMKVLEFAFDAREESDYLPHNYDKHCIVYTGTHDNETVIGWMENANIEDVNFAKRYLKLNKEEGYNWGFIRGALSSVANLAIAQLQDYLGFSSEARMNIPSTVSGNWQWRVDEEYLNDKLASKIKEVTKLYGR